MDDAGSPAVEALRPVLESLRRLRQSSVLAVLARVGLAGRGVFYLLLAGLAALLLVGVPDERQANANGALTAVAATPVGLALLAAAAVGFAAFAVARLAGSVIDRRHGVLRRLTTAGQGLFYLGLTYVTVAFLLGRHAVGSEGQQKRTTNRLLDLPGGRILVVAVGVVLLSVCAWQLVVAATDGFADTLDIDRAGRSTRRLVKLTGRIGIPARALAFAPVGAFFIVAGFQADPQQSKGLDAVLLELTRSGWGWVLVVVVVGFVVFAVYSFFEARFREVFSGA